MKIRLKVLKGSSAGKEVKIPVPECVVGRSGECHLRPKSDAISRRHCMIRVEDGTVTLTDFGSKNGTYVNERRVEGHMVIKSGDKLRIGPLAFEVMIDHSLGGEKKPKVKSVKEAAERASEASRESTDVDDADINAWLEEADDLARTRRYGDPETRQLKLDETDQVTLSQSSESSEQASDETAEQQAEPTSTAPDGQPAKDKKKRFGKLPRREEVAPKDSREAAAHMLKKFFSNR